MNSVLGLAHQTISFCELCEKSQIVSGSSVSRSCSFACLPHQVTSKFNHRKTQCELKNLDPLATFAWIVKQTELCSPRLFMTVVGRDEADMRAVSNFQIQIAKLLFD